MLNVDPRSIEDDDAYDVHLASRDAMERRLGRHPLRDGDWSPTMMAGKRVTAEGSVDRESADTHAKSVSNRSWDARKEERRIHDVATKRDERKRSLSPTCAQAIHELFMSNGSLLVVDKYGRRRLARVMAMRDRLERHPLPDGAFSYAWRLAMTHVKVDRGHSWMRAHIAIAYAELWKVNHPELPEQAAIHIAAAAQMNSDATVGGRASDCSSLAILPSTEDFSAPATDAEAPEYRSQQDTSRDLIMTEAGWNIDDADPTPSILEIEATMQPSDYESPLKHQEAVKAMSLRLVDFPRPDGHYSEEYNRIQAEYAGDLFAQHIALDEYKARATHAYEERQAKALGDTKFLLQQLHEKIIGKRYKGCLSHTEGLTPAVEAGTAILLMACDSNADLPIATTSYESIDDPLPAESPTPSVIAFDPVGMHSPVKLDICAAIPAVSKLSVALASGQDVDSVAALTSAVPEAASVNLSTKIGVTECVVASDDPVFVLPSPRRDLPPCSEPRIILEDIAGQYAPRVAIYPRLPRANLDPCATRQEIARTSMIKFDTHTVLDLEYKGFDSPFYSPFLGRQPVGPIVRQVRGDYSDLLNPSSTVPIQKKQSKPVEIKLTLCGVCDETFVNNVPHITDPEHQRHMMDPNRQTEYRRISANEELERYIKKFYKEVSDSRRMREKSMCLQSSHHSMIRFSLLISSMCIFGL